MSDARLPIAVVVITHNEEANLGTCLASVSAWAGQVMVVDSGSTDRTLAIAAEHGATVVTHAFETHSRQWRWALDNLDLHHEWVLGLDADQAVTPALADELRRRFGAGELPAGDGLYVKRRQVFRGRWIRHGGYYPKYLLKLFRRSSVVLDLDEVMDHHFYVPGRTGRLANDIIEHNVKEDDIRFWLQKHIRYADLMASEILTRAQRAPLEGASASILGQPNQRALWLKRSGYALPAYWRAAAYFLFRYIVQRGFMDGREGFVFHFMHAMWFRVLVDVRLEDRAGQGSTAYTLEES